MLNESQWTVLSPLWRFKSQTLFWTHKTIQVKVQPTGWLGYLYSAGLTGWQRSASRMCSPDSVKIKPSYPPCTECWLGTPVASHSIRYTCCHSRRWNTTWERDKTGTDKASDISAFVTPDHFLQYTVMAFGMRNAPATFQRLMNIVLGDVPQCNVYLDDVVVYSNDWESHLASLEIVFERLANATLTLNLAKCDFARATVTYLGKQVGQGQVRPVEAKVAAVHSR